MAAADGMIISAYFAGERILSVKMHSGRFISNYFVACQLIPCAVRRLTV